MKKLDLTLDALCVESFETAAAAEDRGTVVANAKPTREGPSCLDHTCGCPTWDPGSCYPDTRCVG